MWGRLRPDRKCIFLKGEQDRLACKEAKIASIYVMKMSKSSSVFELMSGHSRSKHIILMARTVVRYPGFASVPDTWGT